MDETATKSGHHPSRGALIRILDGEEDDAAVREHVEACSECRERYERLAAWSEGVSQTLDAVDPVVRERRARHRDGVERGARVPRWMKVAAGIVLLLSGSLAVGPVRAWVVSQAETVAERLGSVAPPSESPGGPSPGGSSVSFVPASSSLVIRFASRQQTGRLIVSSSAASTEVTASVLGNGDSGLIGFILLPSRLTIRNRPESRADYRVVVPATLQSVEVRMRDSTLARATRDELQSADDWTVELEPEGGSPERER